MDRIKGRRKHIGTALIMGAVLAGASACSANASSSAVGSSPSTKVVVAAADAKTEPTVKPKPKPPADPPMLLDTIEPEDGSTVGVAMPISVNFSNPVATTARAGMEQHMKVSASKPVEGAWHWFTPTRADWRPMHYWTSGTQVTLKADLAGVKDGNGRTGVHSYMRHFTIGSDVETTVSVPNHSMTVTENGKQLRTIPVDAGSPSFPSWDGTMAVMDKQTQLRMTSCSVGIACNKNDPDFYDVTLPWDVHLTASGTYLHYSTGDPDPGHAYGSHGCVHLSMANAKWYYDLTKQGDPVTITGSPRGKAAGDNGYADFNLSWSKWLGASGTGQQTTIAL
jgi:lipoprotein-anchoring transpeptidase ErfK/SrfK